MRLDIIAPDKNVYSGDVEYVQLPGIDGLFGVLKDHAPTISGLQKGIISVLDSQKQEISFDIQSGVAEISQNKIVVLVN